MSVIIVGGGMAGATLALALSHLTNGRLAIDLIETNPPENELHPGFDSRAIALAIGTCQALERIGVWPALSDYAEPIKSICVSDRGYLGRVLLSADEHQLPAFGYVIELHEVGRKLFSLLQKHNNIKLHCPARMVGVKQLPQRIEITLDSGETLTGLLAVAADGSHSPLASALNIKWQQTDYHQIAVITNVVLSDAKEGYAFERFTRHGPLALLPLANRRHALVWCHDATRKNELTGRQDADFINELQRELGWSLGRIEKIGRRYCYPLVLRRAERVIAHRLALVGNAAQTLHPIAGQGFNLGLRDVITLAEVVKGALNAQHDLGSYAVLSQYKQARQTDQQQTIGLTDNLMQLFTNHSLLLAGGRNLGMTMMDASLTVQNMLIQPMLGQFKR